ncbi:LysR family transcriptional regulator [Acinetobacter sp. B5B]|uniref:LysR family transcriptional regulator n=1 Tax=Acinetobacter baretiae TaxID=2605383 RepID=UPI0018C2D6E9|nr:LysR family transcriptional regulator [Acinetobacter baretiae]MBF7684132.1 LysR family transcriptional regulator [Acinetobacter baretiae]
MNELKNLIVFTTVATHQSFSKAAEELFLTRSAVSKIVNRLEQDLQVCLFHRTTRDISLTNEGTIFYEYSKKAINELETAKDIINNNKKELVGNIKISVPVILGKHYIAPLLQNLLKEHKLLTVNISFNDEFIDLNHDDIDIVIRTGHVMKHHNLSHKMIGNHKMIVCGSHSYFKDYGIPLTLDDLNHHESIVYARKGFIHTWKFLDHESNLIEIIPKSRFTTDNSEVVLDSILAGNGIGWLPSWLAQPYINRGQLKEVLQPYQSLNFPINVIWRTSDFIPSRIRLLIDQFISSDLFDFIQQNNNS